MPSIGNKVGQNDLLKKIWIWVTKILTIDEKTKRFLIVKDSDGNTAWYLAAKRSYIAVRDQLYELAQTENEPTIFYSMPQKTT
jgi:hypothetical protein